VRRQSRPTLTNAQQHHMPNCNAQTEGDYGSQCSDVRAKFCGHLQCGILSKSNNAENRGETALTPLSKAGFHWADFQGTHSLSHLQLCGDLIFQISPISVTKWGKYRQISYHIVYPSAKHSFTKHIFTKLTTARRFVKNAYTEFHENSTNGVVADTTSRLKDMVSK
jgi:hypothetical protein